MSCYYVAYGTGFLTTWSETSRLGSPRGGGSKGRAIDVNSSWPIKGVEHEMCPRFQAASAELEPRSPPLIQQIQSFPWSFWGLIEPTSPQIQIPRCLVISHSKYQGCSEQKQTTCLSKNVKTERTHEVTGSMKKHVETWSMKPSDRVWPDPVPIREPWATWIQKVEQLSNYSVFYFFLCLFVAHNCSHSPKFHPVSFSLTWATLRTENWDAIQGEKNVVDSPSKGAAQRDENKPQNHVHSKFPQSTKFPTRDSRDSSAPEIERQESMWHNTKMPDPKTELWFHIKELLSHAVSWQVVALLAAPYWSYWMQFATHTHTCSETSLRISVVECIVRAKNNPVNLTGEIGWLSVIFSVKYTLYVLARRFIRFWCSFVSRKNNRISRLWQLCRNEVENESTCWFWAWPVAISENGKRCRYVCTTSWMGLRWPVPSMCPRACWFQIPCFIKEV